MQENLIKELSHEVSLNVYRLIEALSKLSIPDDDESPKKLAALARQASTVFSVFVTDSLATEKALCESNRAQQALGGQMLRLVVAKSILSEEVLKTVESINPEDRYPADGQKEALDTVMGSLQIVIGANKLGILGFLASVIQSAA